MSKEKKFLRRCVGCGEYKEKKQLIKLLIDSNDKELYINPEPKRFGRSAYICPSSDCLNKAFKGMRVAKALKQNIDKTLKEKIKTVLEE